MEADRDARLLDAIADSLIETPDQEFLAELRQEGVDTRKVADRVRSILLNGVRNHYLKQRMEASNAAKRVHTSASSWPRTTEALIALVQKSLKRLSPQQQLTLCHRELREMTDSDLRSTLDDLRELGLVEDESESTGPDDSA